MANFSDIVSPLVIGTVNIGGGSNVTLTTVQTNPGTILLTGALTANVIVYFPARLKIWSVVNNTTGAFTVTLAMTGGSATTTVTQGFSKEFYCDSTIGIYVLGSDISSGTSLSTSSGASTIGFLQSGAGAVQRTVQNKLSETISILDFGAVCNWNGTTGTDDTAAVTAAFTAALASGKSVVVAPSNGRSFFASGLTIPAGITFQSEGFIASSSTALTGYQAVFANTVATCITLSGNGGLASAGLKRISVTRVGIPPAGSKGVYVNNGYNPVLEDILSMGHAIPFVFDGTTGGISCSPVRLYSAYATDAHILVNAWPELRPVQCRFGSNGLVDVACNAYVRISGGGTGPNTLMFDNCQFNQGETGTNVIGAWLQFQNLGSGQGANVGQFSFANCHVEQAALAVQTDSTVTLLDNLTIINTRFQDNAGTAEFWGLNAATTLQAFKLADSTLTTHTFTLAPGAQMNGVNVSDTTFFGAASITGISNSVVNFEGCTFNGLTLAGSFGSAKFSGMMAGGSLSNTATGTVDVLIPGSSTINAPLVLSDQTTGSASFTVKSTSSNTNGVNLKLIGNGATTPSKTIRVQNGTFQISNDAYSSLILTLSDAGNLAITGNFSAVAGSYSGVITSTVATGTAPLVVASTTNVANLNASSLNGATFAAPGNIGTGTAAAAIFTGVTLGSTNALQWGTNSYLYGGTANIIEQYNSTNSQIFNIYNTRTDASNYERGALTWLSNTFSVGTEAAGTGTPRNFALRTNGSTRWIINGTNGFLSPGTDATIDFGNSGARIRNSYQSGIAVNAGSNVATPTTGTTVTVAQTTNFQAIDPAGTLAALTIQFPTPLGDGHTFETTISQSITALTLTPNSGATIKGGATAVTTYAAYKFRYVAANTTWYSIV